MIETQAKLGSIAPFFIVRNLQETVSFYTVQLGFEIRYMGPDDDPYWAMLGRGDVQIFVKAITPDIQPIPNPSRHEWAAWDAYVYVLEPEVYAAELSEKGCTFRTPLGMNSDNLLGFEIEDPNGYVFYFGRPN